VVFDFDGVFTNNKVVVSQDGSEAVVCSRADGLGLSRLRELGVDMMILSTETNPVVSARAAKLRIDCVQGCADKERAFLDACAHRGVRPEQAAFVGNDINDIGCQRSAGVPIVVADAYPEAARHAKLRTTAAGGCGAVREVCDALYAVRKRKGARNR